MRLKIQYYNRNYALLDAELHPVQIERAPIVQTGKKRYRYIGIFPAPSDAELTRSELRSGYISAEIIRKLNPAFKPSDLVWDCDAASITGVTL